MVKGVKDAPLITYMIIDTTGKTLDELKREISEAVERKFRQELEEVNIQINTDVYENIKMKMNEEKDKIVKSFIYQIEHIEEIKEFNRHLVKAFFEG